LKSIYLKKQPDLLGTCSGTISLIVIRFVSLSGTYLDYSILGGESSAGLRWVLLMLQH